jgi:ATP-dependent DNA ligase
MQLLPPKPIRAPVGGALHRSLSADAAWCCEVKPDGDRCIVMAHGSSVRLFSRFGRELSAISLEPIRRAIGALNLPEGTILDGELCTKVDPRWMRHADAHPLAAPLLWLWDRPSPEPLHARRHNLTSTLGNRSPHLRQVPASTGDVAQAIADGFEGVVFKRLDSFYPWQSSTGKGCEVPFWVKVKP